ncbi:hypothetical protein [Spiroplasma sp. DGKH1]|uniref:hypothetical protein n=1 Tax=Spiroplasma sp. DGKH1 TaxID=3050074 RepID=UPI0034C5B88A
MANGVEIRIRLYNKEQIEKFNQFISSKTTVGTKNKILSDLLISAIDNEMVQNYSSTINELIKTNLNNILNYKLNALIKYLDKNNAETLKRDLIMDDMLTFIMNQLGSLTNDYDTHNNPPKALRIKPEWITNSAEEIAEKLKHFNNIKEYHDIFEKEKNS